MQQRPWSLLDALIVFSAAQGAAFLILFGLGFVRDAAPINPSPVLMAVITVPVVLLAGTLIIFKKNGGLAFLRSRLPAKSIIRQVPVGILAGLIIKGVADLSIILERDLLGVKIQSTNPFVLEQGLNASPGIFAGAAIAVTVFIPLAEEIFFRGYVYTAIRQRLHPIGAVGLSAFIFGFAHLNLSLLGPLTLIGLSLILLFEYTGSLTAPIVAHATLNAFAVLLSRFVST